MTALIDQCEDYYIGTVVQAGNRVDFKQGDHIACSTLIGNSVGKDDGCIDEYVERGDGYHNAWKRVKWSMKTSR
jgi:hypothetical protein